MNNVIEKRRGIIISVLYFAIILAAFYLIFKTFFGILVPFIFAFLVAAALQKPVRFISKKTHINRSAVGSVSVLLILGITLFLLFLLCFGIAGKIRDFYNFIILKLQNLPAFVTEIRDWTLNAVSFLPESLRETIHDNLTLFFNDIIENGFENISISNIDIDWSSIFFKGGSAIKDTVAQIPSVVVAIVISVVACIFLTVDYDRIHNFIVCQFNENNQKRLSDARNLALSILKKMGKAYGLIFLITASELTIGLYIFKFIGIFDSPYILMIACIIALIDIVPVLGTGTVLIPWAIYMFITGDISLGVALVILYAVILVIRQILEPKLVAGQVGLPPIVTIIAMYIGTKTLGVLGFFILPFVVILIKEFNENGIIHIFKNVNSEETAGEKAAVQSDAQEEAGS